MTCKNSSARATGGQAQWWGMHEGGGRFAPCHGQGEEEIRLKGRYWPLWLHPVLEAPLEVDFERTYDLLKPGPLKSAPCMFQQSMPQLSLNHPPTSSLYALLNLVWDRVTAGASIIAKIMVSYSYPYSYTSKREWFFSGPG